MYIISDPRRGRYMGLLVVFPGMLGLALVY